jgi:FtsH-binding integral membrane protein
MLAHTSKMIEPSAYAASDEEMGVALKPATVASAHFAVQDAAVRRGFARKVAGIVAAQLAVTFCAVACAVLLEPLGAYLRERVWPLAASSAAALLCVVVLVRSPAQLRAFPSNLAWLGAITLAESASLACLCVRLESQDVVLAAAASAALGAGLALFAVLTDLDATDLGAYLLAALSALLFFCVAALGVPALQGATCAAGLLLFSMYLVHDVQLIVGDRHNRYDVDDYVLASLQVYLDLLNIFVRVLRIVGKRK